MKLLSSGSHNIAWFKLAEYVARGEKERALNVHKLLMHSVADAAFACQLQADILLAFDDAGAIAWYHQAAALYKKQKNYHNALAVYEHVALIKKDIDNLQLLVAMYEQQRDQLGMVHAFARLADVAVQSKKIDVITADYDRCAVGDNYDLQAQLSAAIFFALLEHHDDQDMIKKYLVQALDLFMHSCDSHAVTKFIAKLHACDETFYDIAQEYLISVQD